jgi:hypothetical protein
VDLVEPTGWPQIGLSSVHCRLQQQIPDRDTAWMRVIVVGAGAVGATAVESLTTIMTARLSISIPFV